ncbi:MAG: hypothetical protein MR689_10260, partial [Bacteroidales bacterium]|nr:hypothetical protein [Bacteroidales bacterium]
ADFKPRLEISHTTSPTTGAKHWHRQKAVFYVFVSFPQYFSTEPTIPHHHFISRWGKIKALLW